MKKILIKSFILGLVVINSGFITNVYASTGKVNYKQQNTKNAKLLSEFNEKDKLANLYYEFKSGNISKNDYNEASKKIKFKDEKIVQSNINITRAGSSGRIRYLEQQPQQRDYYCGPATAASILKAKGYNYAQSTLAGKNYLQTEMYGNTPWFTTGTSYPMRDTLNKILNTNYYSVYAAHTNSTSELMNKVIYSVDRNYGIAANVKTVPNGDYFLVDHPQNFTIEHWVAIRGYEYVGLTGNSCYINYVEPVYNATSVSWYNKIKKPSYDIDNYKMAYCIWEKGLVW